MANQQLVRRAIKKVLAQFGVDYKLPPTEDELRTARRVTCGRFVANFGKFKWFEGDEETRVTIGSFAGIASNVIFYCGGEHHLDWVSTYALRYYLGMEGVFEDGQPHSKGDIHVGNDVLISEGAIVLSGVTIGDGAVVGANAVVAKDVRPYAVVVGNPAREVKRRFSDEDIEALLRLQWWDWEESLIREAVSLINGRSIHDLQEFARERGLAT